MKILKSALFCSAVLLSSTAFSGAEVIVTNDMAKSNSVGTTLDLFTNGDVTAFEFEIPLKKGETVDLSQCVSEVPSTHQGHCKLNPAGDRVIVLAISPSNQLLESGVVSVGKIKLSSNRNVEIQSVIFTGMQGKIIENNNSQVEKQESATQPVNTQLN